MTEEGRTLGVSPGHACAASGVRAATPLCHHSQPGSPVPILPVPWSHIPHQARAPQRAAFPGLNVSSGFTATAFLDGARLVCKSAYTGLSVHLGGHLH